MFLKIAFCEGKRWNSSNRSRSSGSFLLEHMHQEAKMAEYSEEYYHRYFDNFSFFDPECRDKRVREINMRARRCLACKGFPMCKMHPEFWLEGSLEREREDQRTRAESGSPPEGAN